MAGFLHAAGFLRTMAAGVLRMVVELLLPVLFAGSRIGLPHVPSRSAPRKKGSGAALGRLPRCSSEAAVSCTSMSWSIGFRLGGGQRVGLLGIPIASCIAPLSCCRALCWYVVAMSSVALLAWPRCPWEPCQGRKAGVVGCGCGMYVIGVCGTTMTRGSTGRDDVEEEDELSDVVSCGMLAGVRSTVLSCGRTGPDLEHCGAWSVNM